MTDVVVSQFPLEVWPRAISLDYLAARLDWTGEDCDAVSGDLGDCAAAVRVVCAVASEAEWMATQARERIASTHASEVDVLARAARAAVDIAAGRMAESTDETVAQFQWMSLAVLAFLPSIVPVSLLPVAALTLDSPALAPFLRLGLLTAALDVVRFDPLLQNAVRHRLRSDQKAYGVVIALTVAERSDSLDTAFAVLGHIVTMPEGAIPPTSLEKAAKLAHARSKDLHSAQDQRFAREMTRLGIEIDHRRHGNDDDIVGIAYSNFGDRLRRAGDLAGARDAYLRSIEVGTASHGPDHARIGLRLAKLGGVLKRLKDAAAAKDAYERSVRIGESTLRATDEVLAIEVADPPPMSNVLVDVYGENTGELIDDLRAYAGYLQSTNDDVLTSTRCLFLADTLPEDGFVADTDTVDEIAEYLVGQSIFLRRQELLGDARRILERVIEIRERLAEPDEIKLGRTLATYVVLLQQIGDGPATRVIADRLRAMRKSTPPSPVTPKAPPDTSTAPHTLAGRYEKLGTVLRDLDDLEAARAAFERSIALTAAAMKSGKEMTNRLDQLASILARLDLVDDACAAYERAVIVADRSDPTGAAQANRLDQLAALRKQSHRLDGALAALWKAVAVDEAGERTNTRIGAIHLKNLALALQEAGDLTQAEAVFERALRAASYRSTRDDDTTSADLPLRTILMDFAMLMRRKGDLDTAIWYAKRAVDLDKSSKRPVDEGVAARLANAAVIMYDRGEYRQSAATFEEARTIRIKLFGEDDSTAQFLNERLIDARSRVAARAGAV